MAMSGSGVKARLNEVAALCGIPGVTESGALQNVACPDFHCSSVLTHAAGE